MVKPGSLNVHKLPFERNRINCAAVITN